MCKDIASKYGVDAKFVQEEIKALQGKGKGGTASGASGASGKTGSKGVGPGGGVKVEKSFGKKRKVVKDEYESEDES
jgi:hypothetical protein